MTSKMDYFLQNCPRRTNVHTPQETKSSQKIADLPWAHSEQSDYNLKTNNNQTIVTRT